MNPKIFTGLLFAFVLFSAVPAVAATEVVARSGQASPLGGGSTYGRLVSYIGGQAFARPMISDSGRVCLWSVLNGAPPGQSVGVFCERGFGSQVAWLQSAQPTDVGPGVFWGGHSEVQMNPRGDYQYVSSLSGPNVQPGVDGSGTWYSGAQGTRLILRDGNPVPGNPDWISQSLIYPRPNFASPMLSGPHVFHTRLTGSGLGVAANFVLAGDHENLSTLISNNQILPGQSDPNVSIFQIESIWGAKRGSPAFGLLLAGSSVGTVNINGVTVATNKALVSSTQNGLHLIGRTGVTQVPGMVDGVRFLSLHGGNSRNDVNTDGDVAFTATMIGPGLAVGNNGALFLSRQGVTQKILQLLSPAPIPGTSVIAFGVGSGVSELKLADDDGMIFSAMISGTGVSSSNNATFIYHKDGVSRIVARGGLHQTGLPTGTYLVNSSFGQGVKISTMGHLAMASRLAGTGVNSSNDVAVVLWDPESTDGTLHVAAREGDLIEDRYRVTTLLEGANTDIKINSSGQVVFTATAIDTQNQQSKKILIAGQYGLPSKVMAAVGETIPEIGAPLTNFHLRSLTGTEIDFNTLNNSGEVVFVAEMVTGTDEAVVVMNVNDFLGDSNACYADFNDNGTIEVADIFAFLSAWFAGNLSADSNGNGSLAVDDIFAFLSGWFAGC